MTHPNLAAYSAGAVCCPDEATARRHDRAGWRATWVDTGGLFEHPTIGMVPGPGRMTLTWLPPTRRWTR